MAAALEKYGEPLKHDPNFKGPHDKRGCTDILCLLFFTAFLVGWGGVGYYAFTHGNLDRLLVPIDSGGRRCGVDSAVRTKPYLLFFDLSKCADPAVPLNGCPTPQICVENCPSENFIFKEEACTSVTFPLFKEKIICNGAKDILTDCAAIANSVKDGYCAEWYLKSDSLFKRCMSDLPTTTCPYLRKSSRARKYRDLSNHRELLPEPDHQKSAVNEGDVTCKKQRELSRQIILEKMAKTDSFIGRVLGNIISHISNENHAQEVGQMVVEDIVNTWPMILVGLVLSMVVCLIFIAVLRWLAGPTIWVSIVGVLGLLFYGIYFSATRYIELKNNPVEKTAVSPNLKAVLNSYLTEKTTWLYILIGLSIFTLVIVLIILVLRKRIVIAIALVKEGSKAVSSIISTVFFPILPWILQIGIIGFSIMVLLNLMSVGTEVYTVSGMNKTTTCACTGATTYLDGEVCLPDVFNQDCRARQSNYAENYCIDAGCHFNHLDSPREVSYFHGMNVVGFFWVVCFITAFGEMVLAATFASWYWTFKKSNVPFFTLTRGFARTIRFHLGTLAFGALIIAICQIIRVILEYVDRKLKKFDNSVTRAIMCMFKCFFWCLEKFLRFLNRNAYIMCAIHGKNFCGSAQDAFNLLMRNFLRVIALDQVTDFLFFLCKVLISLGMGACAYFYFGTEFAGYNLNSELAPAIVVVIGAYLISSVFFGVYSMAVDTLFLCFLEDCERNDGTADKPYFMSKQLMRILGKKNKFNVSNTSNRSG